MNLKNNPRIKIKNLNATKKGAYKKKKYKKNKTSYIYNPLNLRIKTLKMLNNRKNKKSYLTNKHDTLTFIKQIYPNNKCKSLHDNSCVLFKNNQYDNNITLLMNEQILTNKNKNTNVAMVYKLPIRKRYYLYKFPLNSSVYKKKQGKYILRKGAASFLNNACEIYLPKLYLNNKQEIINDNTIVMSYLIIAHKKCYSGEKDIPLLENVQSGGAGDEIENLLKNLKECDVHEDSSGALIQELEKCNTSSYSDKSSVSSTSNENSALKLLKEFKKCHVDKDSSGALIQKLDTGQSSVSSTSNENSALELLKEFKKCHVDEDSSDPLIQKPDAGPSSVSSSSNENSALKLLKEFKNCHVDEDKSGALIQKLDTGQSSVSSSSNENSALKLLKEFKNCYKINAAKQKANIVLNNFFSKIPKTRNDSDRTINNDTDFTNAINRLDIGSIMNYLNTLLPNREGLPSLFEKIKPLCKKIVTKNIQFSNTSTDQADMPAYNLLSELKNCSLDNKYKLKKILMICYKICEFLRNSNPNISDISKKIIQTLTNTFQVWMPTILSRFIGRSPNELLLLLTGMLQVIGKLFYKSQKNNAQASSNNNASPINEQDSPEIPGDTELLNNDNNLAADGEPTDVEKKKTLFILDAKIVGREEPELGEMTNSIVEILREDLQSNQSETQIIEPKQKIEPKNPSTCGLDNNKFKMRLPPLPTIDEIDSANRIIVKSSYSIGLEFGELLTFLNNKNNSDPNDKKNKFNIDLANKIHNYNPPIENTSQSTTSILPASKSNNTKYRARGNSSGKINSSGNGSLLPTMLMGAQLGLLSRGGSDINHHLSENEIKRDGADNLTEYYIDYELDDTDVKIMELPDNDSFDLNNKDANQFINYCKLAKFGTTQNGYCKEHPEVKTHEWNTWRKKWIRTNYCPNCLEECEKTIAKITQKIYTMNKKLNEFEGAMKENKMRLDQFNNARLKYKKQWKAKKFDRNGKCIDENHNSTLCPNVTEGRIYGVKCQTIIIKCPECKDEYLNYFIKYLNAFKTNKDLKHIIEIIKKNIKQLKECKQITSALTKTEKLASLGKSQHSPGRIKADAEAAGMSEEDWMGLSPTRQKERLVNARKAHAANMTPDEYEKLSEDAKAALDKQVHDARIAGVDLTTWNTLSSEDQANMIEKAKQREINDDSQGNSSNQSNMSNNNDYPGMPFTGKEDEMILFRTRIRAKLLREILNNSNLTGISTDGWFQNIIEDPSFNKHEEPGASPTDNNEGQSPNDGVSPSGQGHDGEYVEDTHEVSVKHPEEVIPPHVVEDHLKKKKVDGDSNTDDECEKIKNDLPIILSQPSPNNISECEDQQDNITFNPLSDTDINNIVEFPGNKCTSREKLLNMSLTTGLKNPFTNVPLQQNEECLSKETSNSILQDLIANNQ